jgi:hypothetical protein
MILNEAFMSTPTSLTGSPPEFFNRNRGPLSSKQWMYKNLIPPNKRALQSSRSRINSSGLPQVINWRRITLWNRTKSRLRTRRRYRFIKFTILSNFRMRVFPSEPALIKTPPTSNCKQIWASYSNLGLLNTPTTTRLKVWHSHLSIVGANK